MDNPYIRLTQEFNHGRLRAEFLPREP